MRIYLVPLLALFAALPAFQGCATAGSAPEAMGPAATDLLFGIRAIGGVNGAGWTAEAQKRQVNHVHLVSESNPGNVDVILRAALVKRGTRVSLETVSARTGETLTRGEATYMWMSASWKEVIDHLVVNFRKDTELYRKIAAERDADKPAGTVSRADLEEIVQKAVAGASPKAGGAAAPGPRPSEVDAPSYKAAERPDDFAVVIGIDGYSEIPSAQFAERDAAAVRRHFAALGVPERNIISLQGAKAGKAAFVKTFETWLPLNAGPESTVWVYYSGHGAPDPRTGSAYLLPWDGDPQFLDDTAYPLKRLYAKLDALKAKRVVLAMDACFSGAGGRSVLAKGVRPLVSKADVGVSGKTVALTASAADEVTGTIEEQGHGLFTYHLLKGLNGAAADARGRVTLEGLHDYLVPKVRDDARRQNRAQTPQLMQASSGAERILLR